MGEKMNKPTISKKTKAFLVDLARICKKRKVRFHCKDVFIYDGKEDTCELEFIESEFIEYDFPHGEALVFRPRPETYTDLYEIFVSGEMKAK